MDLKFYRVNHALVKVGFVPQVESIEKEWGVPLVEFVGMWDILSEEEAATRVYPLVARSVRTKFTDLLSCYNIKGYGAIISERLKNIFSEYNIGCQYQYVKVSIVTKKGEPISTPYYHLHLPMPGIVDKINYPKSVFYVKKFGKRINDTPIEVKSFEDDVRLQKITRKQNVSALILAEDIVLKKGTDLELLDIFVFSGNSGGSRFMVSERLKQRLEQEKITGITFEEYPYTISIDE
ncbi:MAG: hypothetical protein IKK86_05875 [Alistipes sp.]|nr:hypothetical protein [Alistipes sp.]